MKKTKQLISKVLLLTMLLTSNATMPVLGSAMDDGISLDQPSVETMVETPVNPAEEKISIEEPLQDVSKEPEVEESLVSSIEKNEDSKVPLKSEGLDVVDVQSVETLADKGDLIAGEAVKIAINVEPTDAVLFLVNGEGQRVFKNSDATYDVIAGEVYTYHLTKLDYVGISDTFTASGDLNLSLVKALENTNINKELPSAWPNFRGNNNNNGVVKSLTPTKADDTSLYWANKVSTSWWESAGSPIIVDGDLVFTVGKTLRKMDRFTGELKDLTGELVANPNFNIIPPLYAKGMIFVGLSNGTIQAFDAQTFESLWIYKDVLKGQPNCPILEHNGYIYTGFWNSETKDANFVALSITDEDPTSSNESKVATWTHTNMGGYYWSGSHNMDKAILIGTDDGQSGVKPTSNLLSLNPITGEVIDEINNLNGDIRSAITYDEGTSNHYFTTKGGSFYSVSVDENGKFKKESDGMTYREIFLGPDKENLPMSTSTPVVSNGRAYIGVSGGAQFGEYSGHSITVIDLPSFEIAYQAPTSGYPQTSGLLTTGYDDGYNYVYFIDNYTPGRIRVVKDKPGATQMIDPLNEDSTDSLKDTPILFTPVGAQAQYGINSPIADEYGTLYFKNDSGHMMAVGSKIKKIEITKAPDKTLYGEGEVVDYEGMEVTAHYANGLTRDVTRDIKVSDGVLSLGEIDFLVSYDISLYGDVYDNENENQPGVMVEPATALQDIIVLSTADITIVRDVENKILAINDVTLNSNEAIEDARESFDALSEELKGYVSQKSVLEEKEIDYANLLEVYTLIEALEETTLDSEEAITMAREKFNALDEKLQKEVTNIDVLVAKEAELATEKEEVNMVEDLIIAIGNVTLDSDEAINAARLSFNNLNDLQKAAVSNLKDLEDSEEKLRDLKAQVAEVNLLIANLSGKGIEDKSLIESIVKAYNLLTPRQKEEVENYEKLQASVLKLEEDEQKIAKANEKIQAIGKVTFDKEEQIVEAREFFNSLDDNLKEYVVRRDELVRAEEDLALMKNNVEEVTNLIEELDPAKNTDPSKAREAYNKLTADEKAQIKNLNTLLEAEKAFIENETNKDDEKVDQPTKPTKPTKKPGQLGTSPQTGDAGVMMWMTLFILSGSLLGVMTLKNVKKKKQ